MSQYSIIINLASFNSEDEKVWALISQIERAIEASEIQLNSLTLKKDGEYYARSKKTLVRDLKQKEDARIKDLEHQIRLKEWEILELRKKL